MPNVAWKPRSVMSRPVRRRTPTRREPAHEGRRRRRRSRRCCCRGTTRDPAPSIHQCTDDQPEEEVRDYTEGVQDADLQGGGVHHRDDEDLKRNTRDRAAERADRRRAPEVGERRMTEDPTRPLAWSGSGRSTVVVHAIERTQHPAGDTEGTPGPTAPPPRHQWRGLQNQCPRTAECPMTGHL